MSLELTVAVAAVPSRLRTSGADVLESLFRQAEGKNVEVLCLMDNKRRTVGAKRNCLLTMAKGRFVTFVDDDDEICAHYIASLLQAIHANRNADCIVFDVLVCGYTPTPKRCRYGVEFEHSEDSECFYRKPNHLMCYRTGVAQAHSYLDVSRGEDDEWAHRACQDIRYQSRINDVLYTYLFDFAATETQGRPVASAR